MYKTDIIIALTSSSSLKVICCLRFSRATRCDVGVLEEILVLGKVLGVPCWRSEGGGDSWVKDCSLSHSGLPFFLLLVWSWLADGLQSEKSCERRGRLGMWNKTQRLPPVVVGIIANQHPIQVITGTCLVIKTLFIYIHIQIKQSNFQEMKTVAVPCNYFPFLTL